MVEPAQVLALCQYLRDEPDLQFNLLEDIVADDMFPDYPRFAVSYHLYSILTTTPSACGRRSRPG